MSGAGARKITSTCLAGLALLLLPAPGAGAACFPHSNEVCAGDWPLARHDLRASGSVRLRTPGEEVPRGWSHEQLLQVSSYQPGMTVWSSAAVGLVDGRAVVAAGCYDHRLMLFDAASGRPLWSYITGDGVYATPLLWRDRATGDSWLFATSADGSIYALDASSGQRRWSRPVFDYRPSLDGCRLSAPALGVVDGRAVLFVGYWYWDRSLAGNTQQAGLLCLRATDGRPLWHRQFLDNRVHDPLFVHLPGGAVVLVSSADGNLRALRASDGRLLWSRRETEPYFSQPSAWRDADGVWRIFIGSAFGKLRALRAADGRELWSYPAGHWISGAAALLDAGGGTRVVFGTFANQLLALDAASGRRRWKHLAAGPVYSSPALVERGGDRQAIYTALDNRLTGVDAGDGVLRWSLDIGAPIWDGVPQGESLWASPVAARINGRWMLYLGSPAGAFLAIPLDQAELASTSPPWSNRRFWIIMVLVLAGTTLAATWLSRRQRLR